MTKAPIGIPIVASLAAFVLVLLALFSGAGHPVFLEEFDIITFNTSALGKNLVTESSTSPSSTSSGFCQKFGDNKFGSACASATAAVGSDLGSALDHVRDHVADELAQTLGIKQFYSVHTMNTCEGYYNPNATVSGASHNVTNCTALFAGYNVSAVFDHELSIGPFELNLLSLGFTNEIQDQIDSATRIIQAFAIIFIIGGGFVGLSFLSSTAALFLIPRSERSTLLINVILSGLAMGILTLAVTLVTAGAYVGASKLNEKGGEVGISATPGRTFTAVTWTAVGLTIVTFVYWILHHRRFKRSLGTGAVKYRKNARDSEESYVAPPPVRGPAPEMTSREPEVNTNLRQPAARRDRWGRFHEGVSWNSFPSRISFLSGRHSRTRG